jgi:RNA polymerase sigma factor (sigma-70 family)
MTDRDLIEAAQRGDRDAFGQLVVRYQRMVQAAVYTASGRRDLIEDVTQETFVAAWRSLDRLRDPSRVRPWLYGIARNLARKARRRTQLQTPGTEPILEATPLEELRKREDDQVVAGAVAELPRTYRAPVVLFYYEQCSVQEIATALDVRETAVMQRLSRARRILGESLASFVEVALERRAANATAVAGCVLLALPSRSARAATRSVMSVAQGVLSSAVRAVFTAIATVAQIARATLGWLARHSRVPAMLAATAIAAAVMMVAVRKNEAIAAQNRPEVAATREDAPFVKQPRLAPDGADDARVYHNVALASLLDPAETCARGTRGLVVAALGKDALHRRDGQIYYEPSDELRRVSEASAAASAEDCNFDGEWPELYVMCEGTARDARDGTVTCYPYNPFAR